MNKTRIWGYCAYNWCNWTHWGKSIFQSVLLSFSVFHKILLSEYVINRITLYYIRDHEYKYEYFLTKVLNPLLGTEEKVLIHHKAKCTSLSRQSKQVWTCLRPKSGFGIGSLGSHTRLLKCISFTKCSAQCNQNKASYDYK